MGNKQGSELQPDEKQVREESGDVQKDEKERKKKQRKDLKRRKKHRKKGLSDSEEELSEGWSGRSQVSEKSIDERSLTSGPESWYHSASEPSSRRSSVYLAASSGPDYIQHRCWYPGYEDGSSSQGSKSRSRTPSIREQFQPTTGSLERYPLGVPSREAIDPIHKGGSVELLARTAAKLQKEHPVASEVTGVVEGPETQEITTEQQNIDQASPKSILKDSTLPSDTQIKMPRANLVFSKYANEFNGTIPRGEKRKPDHEIDLSSGRITPGAIQESKRPLLEKTIIPLPIPDLEARSTTTKTSASTSFDVSSLETTRPLKEKIIIPLPIPDLEAKSIAETSATQLATQPHMKKTIIPLPSPDLKARETPTSALDDTTTPGTSRPLMEKVIIPLPTPDLKGIIHTIETSRSSAHTAATPQTTRPRMEKVIIPLPTPDLRARPRSPRAPDSPPPVYASDSDDKRSVEPSSVGGSIYYSCDEGGSVYYSLTSGSEIEDYMDGKDFLKRGLTSGSEVEDYADSKDLLGRGKVF